MHKLSFNLNDPHRHMRTLDGTYGYEEVANYLTVTEELNYIRSQLNALQRENKELREALSKQKEQQTERLNKLIDALAAVTVKQLNVDHKNAESFEINDDGSVTLEYINENGVLVKWRASTIEEDL